MIRNGIGNLLIAVLLLIAPLAGAPARLMHPAPWLALLASWLLLATQPQLGPQQMVTDRRDRFSALAILLALVTSVVVAAVDFGYRSTLAPRPASLWVLGGALTTAAGLALRLWSIRTLGRFFTATVRVVSDQSVVRSGPYQVLRHPSYAGALLVVLGIVALFASGRGLVATLALGIPAYVYRIAVEEQTLIAELGDAYRAYRQETWRLVPFVY